MKMMARFGWLWMLMFFAGTVGEFVNTVHTFTWAVRFTFLTCQLWGIVAFFIAFMGTRRAK